MDFLKSPPKTQSVTQIQLTLKQLETDGLLSALWLRCPGAKAPGHQYPQCWENAYSIEPISCINVSFMVNNIRVWYNILEKNDPVV